MSKLIVSGSPHIFSGNTTKSIMRDVLIALTPAGIASVWLFGLRALTIMVVCVVTAIASEYLTRRILKKNNTIGDLSCVVTGLLLAYNLPVTLPLWMAALGSAIAIVIVKEFFGGLGQNFVNPALVGRIVLMTSFPIAMTTWVAPFTYNSVDAVTTATPLSLLKINEVGKLPSISQMLLGQHGSSLGESCAIALILGGIYLVYRRIISPVIPVTFIATTVILTWAFGSNPVYHMLSGGLLLGAIFMATDYTTSPISTKGKIIYAFGCGLITFVIRIFGSMPEGVSFSIVLMNILVPHIERLTTPKPLGMEMQKK